MNKWLMLGIAIALEVGATLSLRAMSGLEHPWFLAAVVAGYVGAFYFVAKLLETGMQVGVAYGVWAASGVALTAILGSLLFGDPLTWQVGAGIGLIIGGVLLVEIGSQRAEETREVLTPTGGE
ncbi:DMT family transporter [Stackebrandtia nassauensis]|uniref:Small multidrug resistance protein n=1 Tax=Stackebrandtia nassauensis (strain DSM 44728 / CIP 108903 / NRRL B-16338 / NBRC 102104 / LLR-40K-21) TaxID=446470 RepID=D3Q9R7_STANL|nr:SMR family transporter [Stackebrandtia nassauensis]ADD44613.1 small multidrug resistance protein [Stackebrandtia nassauensis DSM 44728]